ncbi:hypothetical protein OG216_17205 [Streptomycetaceae bacterium NBC_01309]
MFPRRAVVVVATGTLAITGAVVLTAPAAQATVVEYTSECVNDFIGSVGEVPSKYDVTVSPVKDKYAVGEQVKIDWKWITYPKVPDRSPLETLPENSTQPFGDIALSGAQADTVQVSGPQEHPAANRGEALMVPDMTGTFTLTGPGTLTLTPKGYKTVTTLGTIKSATACGPVAGQAPGAVATLTVEGASTPDPVLSSPAEAHTGWEIDLNGSNFAPNTTPQLSLCNGDGSNCLPERFASNTLAIDGQGKLTGKATIAPSPFLVPDGEYVVRVSDGSKAALSPMAVTRYVSPDPRTATATPDVAAVGDTVTVTGSGWTAVGNVNIVPQSADGSLVGTVVTASIDPFGKFTAQVLIEDPTTTQIRIREGLSATKRVFAPITVRTTPPLPQDVSATLAPGSLSMSQAGTGIDFGTVTLNGEAQTVKSALNQVTVLDARGGNLGWSLTGTMTDLVAANGTDKIPAGNLAWTPSCAALPGSLSTVANGTPGALSSAASTLCSVSATGTTTGGKFTADAEITLTTPQFAAAGAYTGTLTLTLI